MSEIISQTLATRGSRYGSMEDNANITQRLIGVVMDSPNFDRLDNVHLECLHMIFHKIARMCCGDVWYSDNMHDVAGYAKLLEQYQQGHTNENS